MNLENLEKHQIIWEKINQLRSSCQACKQVRRFWDNGYLHCNYHVVPQILFGLIVHAGTTIKSTTSLILKQRRLYENYESE